MKYFAWIFATACFSATAGPTGFAERGKFDSGWAIVEPAVGGEYVEGNPATDGRLRTKAVLAQVPVRQTYVFFSVDEEHALLNYRNKLATRTIKAKPAAQRPQTTRAHLNLIWPKVVVRNNEVCVPELASSDAADWREHLVCHGNGDR